MAFAPSEMHTMAVISEADIVEAESRYIKPLLGEPLYDRLLNGDYAELVEEYVAPAIAARTRAIVEELLPLRCQACSATPSSAIAALKQKARTLARRMADHLEAHNSSYPEYNPKANPLKHCSIDGNIVQVL